jgi:hypothetical protein
MTTSHTPGPWEIDTDTRPAEICTVHGLPPKDGKTWAYIRGPLGYWGTDENENLANARLIAAAPELLEALAWIRQFIHKQDGGVGIVIRNLDGKEANKWLDRVDAAITKAEGGAS